MWLGRLLFSDLAQTLEARRVVVVDESGTHRGMTSAYARAPRGERAVDSVLRNYGCNVSLIAALRLRGMDALFVVNGSVNTAVFETYTAQILSPTLQPGGLVLIDNLRCHKTDTVRQIIEVRGASILFLPAYSPDLSPIEQAFSKLKQFLRHLKALTFGNYSAISPKEDLLPL